LVRLPAQPRTGFASFDVFAQHGIDGRLVAAAALAEERQDIGIKSQGNLLLGAGPPDCLLKELLVQFGIVRNVDFLIFHRLDALPISPGALSRSLHAHASLPS